MSADHSLITELGQITYEDGQPTPRNTIAEMQQLGYTPYQPAVRLHCPFCGQQLTYLKCETGKNFFLTDRFIVGCAACGLVCGRGVTGGLAGLAPEARAEQVQRELREAISHLLADATYPESYAKVQAYRKHFGHPPLGEPAVSPAEAAPVQDQAAWEPLEAPLVNPVAAILAAGLQPIVPEQPQGCTSCHQPFRYFRGRSYGMSNNGQPLEELAVACADCGIATAQLVEIFSPQANQYYVMQRFMQQWMRTMDIKRPVSYPAVNYRLQEGLDALARQVQRPEVRDWIARYRAAHGFLPLEP